MYTLGTSVIKQLNITQLNNVLIAYVGTATERPDAFITKHACYVEYEGGATAELYVPNVDLTAWEHLQQLPATVVNKKIKPAGGYASGLYAFPRGNIADIANAWHIDGLPFYAKDTQSLYVYDASVHEYKTISGGSGGPVIVDSVPVGAMMLWSAGATVPNKYRLCDGSSISKTTYATLYGLLGDTYGSTSSSTFKLPTSDNTIIKVE